MSGGFADEHVITYHIMMLYLEASDIQGKWKKRIKKTCPCTCPGGPAAARRRPGGGPRGPAERFIMFFSDGLRDVTLCF